MEPLLDGAVTAAHTVLGTAVTATAHAALCWMLLGLGLHLANQVARGRGWWAVVNAAGAGGVRRRHAIAAWIAGAGVAGVVTARLGDLLRVLLVSRVAPGAGRARLAGTLVAEAAGELAVGAVVTGAAVLLGVGGGFGPVGIPVAAVVAVAVVVTLARRAGVRGRRATTSRVRAPRVVAGVRAGCAALCAPRAYARHVLPWQVASRGLRFAALACFLGAFGLPVTVQSVLLVAFAQSAGNAIPFAPAAVAAGAATLAATLGPLTHASAPAARVAGFYATTIGLLSVMGVVCAAAITAVATLSARRPRRDPEWDPARALLGPSREERIRPAAPARPASARES